MFLNERRPARIARPDLLAIAVVYFVAGNGFGQDVIRLRTPDGTVATRAGQIVDWTGAQLLLKIGDRQRKIDATQVIEVQTLWPTEMDEARRLMAAGRFSEAAGKLVLARNSEDRAWVISIITAELVQCLDANDNPAAATLEFLEIYSADPQSRFFYLIPLPWTPGVNPPAEAETAKWMASTNSLLKLLGASWRLPGSDRAEASQVLRTLSDDPDSRIGQLAAAQLWRTEVLTAKEQDVQRWHTQLNRFESKLRAGPYCVLAEVWLRMQQPDQAKINLMKTPILYPEKKSLAAYALFKTAAILNDGNEAEQASMIERELLEKFPESTYAGLMREK